MGSRKKIQLKPVLFIACEGTSSEYNYFSSWGDSSKVRLHFERVNVYPGEFDIKPKTTPFELLGKAAEVLKFESADYVWIVFDKDGHSKLQETFEEATELPINIAFSSRSFEQWILLHFEKSTNDFQVTECKSSPRKGRKKPINCGTPTVPDCINHTCLAGHIRRSGYLADYSKDEDFDLYRSIESRTEIAIVNAAWLRFRKNLTLGNSPERLYLENPYTNVDQLIMLMCNRSDKIEWGAVGNDICLGEWSIIVTRVNDTICVLVSHSKSVAEVTNPEIGNFSFYFTDDNLNHSPSLVECKKLITNVNGSNEHLLYARDQMEYVLKYEDKPYFLFEDKDSNSRIFIEINPLP